MKTKCKENILKVQSRNYCFIIKTLPGRESKMAYKAFADVFKFFENIMAEGLLANENRPRIMPIIVWSPQDLSSIWKSLHTGGGARKTGDKHWCHLCTCTRNKIVSYLVDENRFVVALSFSIFIHHFSYTLCFSLFFCITGVSNARS